ncbi:MAG: type II secretion system protein [Verrucomicrobiota bacterium]
MVRIPLQKRCGRVRPLHGFTLVEIMIVVAIIALLATLAVPNFLRARLRSQAVLVKEDLRMIDDAIGQYAFENNKHSGSSVVFADIKPYLKSSSPLYATGADVLGNIFGPTFTVSVYPYPPALTYQALSGVTDAAFWSPFNTPP